MGAFASIDGNISELHEARVSVMDNGFVFGDSAYETLRTYHGRPFELGRHLRRLRASTGRLGFAIPASDDDLGARLDALLARAQNAESYIRMIVSRGVGDMTYNFGRVQGPTVVMVAKPLEPFPETHQTQGIPVAIVSIKRNSPRALDPAIKTSNLLNNILATREAQAKGGFEALLLNEREELAEGAGSNVFVVRAGRVSTPPLSAGILAGITRELVFELARPLGIGVCEEVLSASDLLRADEAFITSTLKELTPIKSVDGRAVGSGTPGAVTLRLLAAYHEHALRAAAKAVG
jgi:branched-chain amino acid aminotransferase